MPIPISDNCNSATPDIFGTAYLGNVRYYAAMLSAKGGVVIDTNERLCRNSWMHNHCHIIGANGVQTLTVPIEHIDTASAWTGRIVMRDLRISEHGNWRRIHWGALFSAYGKTPFFEYAENDLRAVYENHYKWLIDFNMALHNVVVDFLDLPITTQAKPIDESCHPVNDRRGKVGGKGNDGITAITDVPYYNIWEGRHGHVPALSIIDLLMNCGREAIFIMLEMIK